MLLEERLERMDVSKHEGQKEKQTTNKPQTDRQTGQKSHNRKLSSILHQTCLRSLQRFPAGISSIGMVVSSEAVREADACLLMSLTSTLTSTEVENAMTRANSGKISRHMGSIAIEVKLKRAARPTMKRQDE